MGKIGFKMSWELKKEKRSTRKPKQEEIPMIVPGTAMAHILEIQMKIEGLETYLTSTAYARLNKKEKAEMLEAYRFLLTTMALIQTPTGGVSEAAGMHPMGFID